MTILIKCGSHRTRDKITNLIGERKYLCSHQRNTGYGVFEVTQEEYTMIKQSNIRNYGKMKDGDDLSPAWEIMRL